jgi:hypothetical protein
LAKKRGKKGVRKKVLVKKPLIIRPPKFRTNMKAESAIILFWLSILTLIVLNMFASVTIAIFQLAIATEHIFLIVASFGLLFGFFTHKLVSLIEHLELKHHFFAHVFVPTFAVSALIIISLATNRFSSNIGLTYSHNPLLVGLSYSLGFILPHVKQLAHFCGSKCVK